MDKHHRVLPLTKTGLLLKNLFQVKELRRISEMITEKTAENSQNSLRHQVDLLAITQFIDSGQAEDIAEIDEDIHRDLNIWGASQVVGQDIRIFPELIQETILWTVWQFWRDLYQKYPRECQRVINEDWPY